MVESGQAHLPDPRQDLGERRIPGQVGTQHQGVDEEPDEIVQRLVSTPGHRRTDRDVGARAQSRQQHRQCRLQHHEQCDPLLPGQLQQPLVQIAGDVQADRVPAIARRGRAGPIGGKGQLLRRAVQRLPPVRHLPGQQAARIIRVAQQIPLPQRVVRVLHGQCGPPRSRTRASRRMGVGDVTAEPSHRPAVSRDVLDDQDQDILSRPDREQARPQRCFGRQVERVLGRPDHRVRHGVGSDLRGLQAPPQIVELDDPLVRFAVGHVENGAQYLVPAQHVPQRGLQRVRIDPSGKAQHCGDVVGRALALEPVEEPQPPLCE